MQPVEEYAHSRDVCEAYDPPAFEPPGFAWRMSRICKFRVLNSPNLPYTQTKPSGSIVFARVRNPSRQM
jgi:hypothetical protein